MTEPEVVRDPLSAAVARVVARLCSASSTGEVARLRRLTPEDPGSATLYQVLAACVEPVLPLPVSELVRVDAERAWAVVLQAFAIAPELLDGGSDLGRELAEAGFSELRFERMLRADEDSLPDQLRTAATFLASKGARMNPYEVARLVLIRGPDAAERGRRKIARSFYRVLHTKNKSES